MVTTRTEKQQKLI